MAQRKTREQAELEAYLRHKRAYEKKLDDIRWNYEEFAPLLAKYRQGRLKLSFKKPFELEVRSKDAPD